MRRREFITLLTGAAAVWPLAARGQQGESMRRVGVLFGTSEGDPKTPRYTTAFRQELARLGWVKGGNLQIDFRFAVEPVPAQTAAAELAQLAPDVIYTWGGIQTRVMREQTQTIPIVFIDPSTSVDDVSVARRRWDHRPK